MGDFDHIFDALRHDALRLEQLERERHELFTAPYFSLLEKDDRDKKLKEDVRQQRQWACERLRQLVDFPPQHVRHAGRLADFHNKCSFEKSVFVMTKFPNAKKPSTLDKQLAKVIQAVRDAVNSCGDGTYRARVADDGQYHPLLWDNVELHLLGCKRGIAIVEDKYFPELNPNVAMEWGWMRGMGRNVLYLVEDTFKGRRADWSGLMEKSFSWVNPGPSIKAAVEEWLKKSL